MNRLKLDFSIHSITDREKFIEQYIKKDEFQKKPMTTEELEVCANYILWGKDSDGKNAVQKKEIQIDTRNKTWKAKEEESLNELMESSTFNENSILQPGQIPTKITRKVFDREEALRRLSPNLAEEASALFQKIDFTELVLNYWELAHGKRQKPPRDELRQRIAAHDQLKAQERSKKMNQYQYLKMRHFLVELRKQQYVYKDLYYDTIQKDFVHKIEPDYRVADFETDIDVRPLGMIGKQKIHELLFVKSDGLFLEKFTKNDLEKIDKFLDEQKQKEANGKKYFDFREVMHLYNFVLNYQNLLDSSKESGIDNNTEDFLQTFEFYVDMADLKDIHADILRCKMEQKSNNEIIEFVNKKYGKRYTVNYISTIFKQKILGEIATAAAEHLEIIKNLNDPSKFIRCTNCGRLLLKNSNNFTKKKRSKHGYSSRCKKCEKIMREERQRRKENNEG